MNFLAQVEDHLRDLGAEARKKHPGVKEASERAILALRSLQTDYVSAVRANATAGAPHPSTRLFRSHDVLRPFLLACNYPDAGARLLTIGLNAVQLLLSGDAVCADDSAHVVRVLVIQATVSASLHVPGGAAGILAASSGSGDDDGIGGGGAAMTGGGGSSAQHPSRSLKDDEAICLKVLQTLTMVAASRDLVFGEEVLAQSVAVCLIIIGSRRLGGGGGGGAADRAARLMHQASGGGGGGGGSVGSGGGGGSGGARSNFVSGVVGLGRVVGAATTAAGVSVVGGENITGSGSKVKRAAAATLKQLISLVFDRAEAEALAEAEAEAAAAEEEGVGLPGEGESSTSPSSSPHRGGGGGGGGFRLDREASTSSVHSVGSSSSSTSYRRSAPRHVRRSTRHAAARAFADLCVLAGEDRRRGGGGGRGAEVCRGPFSPALLSSAGMGGMMGGKGAVARGLMQVPPRSACFELLDMILSQRPRLFAMPSPPRRGAAGAGGGEANGSADVVADMSHEFQNLLRYSACPLVTTTLLSEFSSGRYDHHQSFPHHHHHHHRGKRDSGSVRSSPSRSSDAGRNRGASGRRRSFDGADGGVEGDGGGRMDFALLVQSTRLAITIITKYGGRRDRNAAPSMGLASCGGGDGVNDDSLLGGECHVLLMSLIKFVSTATEAYHDTDGFEDGFTYSTNSALNDTSENSSSTVAAPQPPSNAAIHAPELIPNGLLWRAALALDAMYVLTSDPVLLKHLHTSYTDPVGDGDGDDGDDEEEQSSSSSHRAATVVAVLAEAVSDFATIAASNRGSMMAVVSSAAADAGERRYDGGEAVSFPADASEPGAAAASRASKKFHPKIFSRATDFTKLFDEWESTESQIHRHTGGQEIPSASYIESAEEGLAPVCDEGEAIWLAFHCVLSMLDSINSIALSSKAPLSSPPALSSAAAVAAPGERPCSNEGDAEARAMLKSLVDASFAPSLAVMQHFLKRFPGSRVIVKSTLHGYESLANASIPLNGPQEFQRKAILTSLCKLSIPAWGKMDPSCQLQDNHIQALATLLRIIHNNYDDILSEWQIVLSTLEQLSSLSISSPKLSDKNYKIAVSISGLFARVSSFTTCLSPASLGFFVSALIGLSHSAANRTLESPMSPIADDERGGTTTPTKTDELDEESYLSSLSPANNKDTSLGGKLFSLAGRAFGGGGYDTAPSEQDVQTARVLPSKTYSEDFCQAAFAHLVSGKPTTKKDVFQQLPFSLLLLTDATLANSFRFSVFGKDVVCHLCDLASSSAEMRSYAMDTLANLVTSRFSGSSSNAQSTSFGDSQTAICRNPVSLDDYLAVVPVSPQSGDEGGVYVSSEVNNMNKEGSHELTTQVELLTPLCVAVSTTNDPDAAEAGLTALYVILEGAGHYLEGGAWPIIIAAISRCSGDGSDRSTHDWATCGMLAFRCLKLIVDDFLDQLPPPPDASSERTRSALLDCCASFGSSTHDVNTSLTATGMLWSIADQDPTPLALERVLSKLAFLACDGRPEVRNCSVNTLFSCVVGVGHRFSADQWRACLEGTIFGVLDRVADNCGSSQHSNNKSAVSPVSPPKQGTNSTESPRYTVTVHHSRDSADKQWATTQVLTIRGLERVLRQFFPQLLSTTVEASTDAAHDGVRNSSSEDSDDGSSEAAGDSDNVSGSFSEEGTGDDAHLAFSSWFYTAWEHILGLAFRCATETGGRETLDLRFAGVELLVLCTQLSSRGGVAAAAAPVRVSTNMQVVNGALRSVRAADSPATSLEQPPGMDTTNSQLLEDNRFHLFNVSFETLEQFRHFDEHADYEDDSFVMCGGTATLQVLTRLSSGLAGIYECCKDAELAPAPPFSSGFSFGPLDGSGHDENLEARFVNLISHIAAKSVGDRSARYLNQSQRACVDLLSLMSSKSSSKAFETLAVMGGNSFVVKHSSNMDDDSDDDDPLVSIAQEVVEHEAAKMVAEAFVKNGVPLIAKASVLSTILGIFLEKKEDNDQSSIGDESYDGSTPTASDTASFSVATTSDSPACYELLVPVIKGGLAAALEIEKQNIHESTKNDQIRVALLEILWGRMLTTLSYLLSPLDNTRRKTFTPNTSAILDVLSCALAHAPERVHSDLGKVLCNGVDNAEEIARLHAYSYAKNIEGGSETEDGGARRHCDDALKVFEACIVGLCQCQPQSTSLFLLVEGALKDAIDRITSKEPFGDVSAKGGFSSYTSPLLQRKNSKRSSDETNSDSRQKDKDQLDGEINIDVELASIVCESIRTGGRELNNLIIAVFPWLCKLTNTENDRLRRKSGAVLGCVDLAGVIVQGVERAETAEKRAAEAERRNEELEEEAAALREEVENLRRQVEVTNWPS